MAVAWRPMPPTGPGRGGDPPVGRFRGRPAHGWVTWGRNRPTHGPPRRPRRERGTELIAAPCAASLFDLLRAVWVVAPLAARGGRPFVPVGGDPAVGHFRGGSTHGWAIWPRNRPIHGSGQLQAAETDPRAGRASSRRVYGTVFHLLWPDAGGNAARAELYGGGEGSWRGRFLYSQCLWQLAC